MNGASPNPRIDAIKPLPSVATCACTQTSVSWASSQFSTKSKRLFVRALISFEERFLLQSKICGAPPGDCETSEPFRLEGSAVRTGRNETRFVLSEVKFQSRLSSGEPCAQLRVIRTR